MNGKFIPSAEIDQARLDWGQMGWISSPPTTGAKHIVQILVTLSPGGGHNFHKHPHQEETIHVLSGEIEQWLERDRRTLRPGDTIFIRPDTVHASFNTGPHPARLLVVLSPAVGEGGYELADVASEAPWDTLRRVSP